MMCSVKGPIFISVATRSEMAIQTRKKQVLFDEVPKLFDKVIELPSVYPNDRLKTFNL